MGALLVLGATAAFVAVPVALGFRLGMPVRLTLAAAILLAGVWWIGHELMLRGWHDIDGWVDCNRYCNAWHAVGAAWFWAPMVAAAVLVLVAGGVALRRASAGGNRRGTRTTP